MSQAAPSSAPSPVRPSRKRRRLLLALLVLVFAVAGGIFVYLRYAAADLAEVMAELDRLDPGWRLDEIEAGRKPVPEANNSALHVMAVKKLLAGQRVWTPAMDALFAKLRPEMQLSKEQADYLEGRFQLLQKGTAEARKLMDMPDGRFPIKHAVDGISTMLGCQDARDVCQLLLWDAARRAYLGDMDGALESCLALLQAARSVGDEPYEMSQMVRHASSGVGVNALERTLAQGETGELSLRRLQEAVENEARQPTLILALRGDRAMYHRFLEACGKGNVRAGSLGPMLQMRAAVSGSRKPSKVDLAMLENVPGALTHQHAALLRFLTQVVEAGKLAPAERQKRFEALATAANDQPTLVRLLAPAVLRDAYIHDCSQANLLSTAAALAAERFRLAKGRWPKALDELVQAGLLDAVPTDPYDGKPLRLKRTADGLTVYSVGPDGVDNDGAIDRDNPHNPGADLGFRLWDVPRRRQP
jgi:hypothetical protein